MTLATAVPSTDFFAARLDAIAGPVRTVVDVGAHTGSLTLPALARGATVVAVEPCVIHLSALLFRAAEAGAGTLLPVAAAVWDQGGRLLPIYGRAAEAGFGDPGQLSLVPYRESAVVAWAVTVTLAELFAQLGAAEVDLLKVDVEGAEHRILPALPTALLRRCRYIDLDNHDIRNTEFFVQELVQWHDLGFLLTSARFILEPSGLWRRIGGDGPEGRS